MEREEEEVVVEREQEGDNEQEVNVNLNRVDLDFALSGFKVSQKPLFPFCSRSPVMRFFF